MSKKNELKINENIENKITENKIIPKENNIPIVKQDINILKKIKHL